MRVPTPKVRVTPQLERAGVVVVAIDGRSNGKIARAIVAFTGGALIAVRGRAGNPVESEPGLTAIALTVTMGEGAGGAVRVRAGIRKGGEEARNAVARGVATTFRAWVAVRIRTGRVLRE